VIEGLAPLVEFAWLLRNLKREPHSRPGFLFGSAARVSFFVSGRGRRRAARSSEFVSSSSPQSRPGGELNLALRRRRAPPLRGAGFGRGLTARRPLRTARTRRSALASIFIFLERPAQLLGRGEPRRGERSAEDDRSSPAEGWRALVEEFRTAACGTWVGAEHPPGLACVVGFVRWSLTLNCNARDLPVEPLFLERA